MIFLLFGLACSITLLFFAASMHLVVHIANTYSAWQDRRIAERFEAQRIAKATAVGADASRVYSDEGRGR